MEDGGEDDDDAVDRDEQTGEDEVREKDRGGRTRW